MADVDTTIIIEWLIWSIYPVAVDKEALYLSRWQHDSKLSFSNDMCIFQEQFPQKRKVIYTLHLK